MILRARNVTNLSSRLSVPYPHLSLRPAQLSVMVSSNFYPQQRRKKKNVNKQRKEAAQTFPPAEKRTREKKIFPTPSAPPILARCRVKQKKGKKEKGKKKKRKESLSRIDKTSIRISLDRHGGKGVEEAKSKTEKENELLKDALREQSGQVVDGLPRAGAARDDDDVRSTRLIKRETFGLVKLFRQILVIPFPVSEHDLAKSRSAHAKLEAAEKKLSQKHQKLEKQHDAAQKELEKERKTKEANEKEWKSEKEGFVKDIEMQQRKEQRRQQASRKLLAFCCDFRGQQGYSALPVAVAERESCQHKIVGT